MIRRYSIIPCKSSRRLVYPFKAVRTSPETIAANRLSQSGLWRFGISGDYPILLVEIEDPKQVDLIREVLQVYEFLRSRRFYGGRGHPQLPANRLWRQN